MVSPELEAHILRLYHNEHWKIGEIARELHVHHGVVRRVLSNNGVSKGLYFVRPSLADPYIPFIVDSLEKYPKLPASRLYAMVRERGYRGGPDHFRRVVARHRPAPRGESFLRLQVLAGEQAQVDWGHFGTLRVGRAERRLAAFVLVLSWSRVIYLRFFLDQRLENFLRGHEAAFLAVGGVPRVCLYDNLKSVVLERLGDAIRFHPTFMQFAGHYRFEPRPVGVRRANEKGRVERAIRYVRQSFFLARKLRDLDTLNAEAEVWCQETASRRQCPADTSLSVAEALAVERPKLLPLPDTPFPSHERQTVRARKSPYVRFDLNDYSIPHTHTRKTLEVVAKPTTVRILDGHEVIASHARSYGKGETVEDPVHIQELTKLKRQAHRHRATNRLQRAAPLSRDVLTYLAEHGHNLGHATRVLCELLDTYGAKELDRAFEEVIQKGVPDPQAVRQVLERRRRERGMPPATRLRLKTHHSDMNVRPHSLESYDKLQEKVDDEEEPTE